ncbi:MAG TPA: hypothetical protein ENI45_05235 [Thermoplasmatales archaeon]|nr:hypothetical protein [Thermoplasmatales archaeon]
MNPISLLAGATITTLGCLYTFYVLHAVKTERIPSGLLFPSIRKQDSTAHFWFLVLINCCICLIVLTFGIYFSMFSLSV